MHVGAERQILSKDSFSEVDPLSAFIEGLKKDAGEENVQVTKEETKKEEVEKKTFDINYNPTYRPPGNKCFVGWNINVSKVWKDRLEDSREKFVRAMIDMIVKCFHDPKRYVPLEPYFPETANKAAHAALAEGDDPEEWFLREEYSPLDEALREDKLICEYSSERCAELLREYILPRLQAVEPFENSKPISNRYDQLREVMPYIYRHIGSYVEREVTGNTAGEHVPICLTRDDGVEIVALVVFYDSVVVDKDKKEKRQTGMSVAWTTAHVYNQARHGKLQ